MDCHCGGRYNVGAATDGTSVVGASEGDIMRFGPFLVIAILLLMAWGGAFLMFHIASGSIHLLLALAVLAFIFHFVSSPRTAYLNRRERNSHEY
jgi:hypothetical protein